MSVDRRTLLGFSAAGVAYPFGAKTVQAAPSAVGVFGVDASMFGVKPDAIDDQSAALQRAIDAAARHRVPLMLPPGLYRASDLALPSGSQIFGVRGGSRLVLGYGASIIAASGASEITLQGIVFDGSGRILPEKRGLVTLRDVQGVRILDCTFTASGGNGIVLERVEGEITGNTVIGAAKAAIFSLDARGLAIKGNTIREAGNNGILVWRSVVGDDGTLVTGNRIEQIGAKDGGTGQYGNGINVFHAGNVIVADNRIHACAYSAVRGNAASNLQIRGNTCTKLGEVALYSEFGFEGALIATNVIDGAATGISITNFNHGGRLAVCQGNLIRNLFTRGDPKTDPEA
ncbi:MAG TPA: TIGR03808 family TAT-translocated repetitive protein, partial [Xanthobacteraceae bacterium]